MNVRAGRKITGHEGHVRRRGRRSSEPDRRAVAVGRQGATPRREDGSVLILVLFVCLAVAVAIQALSTVIVCAERGAVDESVGRTRLAEKDDALALLRQRALMAWEEVPWTIVKDEPTTVEGRVSELPEGGDWVMSATVRHASAASRLVVTAWLEKGRDGVDLPLAALVAGTIAAAGGRETAWLEVEESGNPETSPPETDVSAVGYGRVLPLEPVLGAGCSLVRLQDPWRLDPGWLVLGAVSPTQEGPDASGRPAVAGGAEAVAAGPGVTVLTGGVGRTVTVPAECGGLTPDAPCLVLAMGGATLDLRTRGDIYGVIVVDDGDLLLEGTTLHGAVFATGTVDLGETGRLLFSRPILRWATDRSLNRVRLVPGTREEGIE